MKNQMKTSDFQPKTSTLAWSPKDPGRQTSWFGKEYFPETDKNLSGLVDIQEDIGWPMGLVDEYDPKQNTGNKYCQMLQDLENHLRVALVGDRALM